jgi:hypothetical protein
MNGISLAAFAASNRGKLFKSESRRTPAQGKSLLSPANASGSVGMPRLKKKKKRLAESPAPVNNGYSSTLG